MHHTSHTAHHPSLIIHLSSAIISCGGKPVQNHPSSFWFEQSKILLTVYVDDLLASGPSGNHESFWTSVKRKVDLDPPEALGRFLGRTHVLMQVPSQEIKEPINPPLKKQLQAAAAADQNQDDGVG